jgi:hypothetical protein
VHPKSEGKYESPAFSASDYFAPQGVCCWTIHGCSGKALNKWSNEGFFRVPTRLHEFALFFPRPHFNLRRDSQWA